MKVAVVAVMVALAMGVAFVGGLLVATKVMARNQQAATPPPLVEAQLKPKEAEKKGKDGEIAKGLEAVAKKEEKKLSTDEMIALVDYSVAESRDIGKLLLRKKIAETMKATEAQLEAETDKAREKAALTTSIQRWLERWKHQ